MFVSSHLMSEMALTAEHLIVIGKGRLIADLPIAEMIAAASRASVLVRSPDAARLADVLGRAGRRRSPAGAVDRWTSPG